MAAALPPSGPNTNGLPPKLSATGRSVLLRRREPGQTIAAAFAVVVHIGFFALIVFGVSWQVKAPAPLSAELWSALPALPVVEKAAESLPPEPPAPPPEPAAKPVPPPKVVEPSKVDIALKTKKEREEKLKREKDEKAAAELKKREDQKRIDDKRRTDEEKSRKADEAKRKVAEAKQKADADRARAEAEAKQAATKSAQDKAMDEYKGKIGALIRNRANIPDNVTGQPVIVVSVRLLTNGAVFEAAVATPSGNRAYDDAVERAINGIRQWPVPDNPEILGRQRELLLNIKHER